MNDTETPSLCLTNCKDLNGKCFQKPVLSTTTEGYDKIRKFNKSGDITAAACIVYMWCGCVHTLPYIYSSIYCKYQHMLWSVYMFVQKVARR